MYVVIWRFVVRPEHASDFEQQYGPNGRWAEFFARGDGFVRTELFRGTTSPNEFLTLDTWRSEEAFVRFVAEHSDEYATIDHDFEAMTEREERIAGVES